jgi:hypothetical protein
MRLPKLLYDYVLFRADDIAQLPIRYATIQELSKMFRLTTQLLHKRFNDNNIIYINDYGIERFKKENK